MHNQELATITSRLKQAEVIAVLEHSFTLADILETADALLASPILALELNIQIEDSLTAMPELRHRAGPHMIIGLSGVNSPEQLASAIAAEAQFTVSDGLNTALIDQANEQQHLHLPTATTRTEIEQAIASQCPIIKTHNIPPTVLLTYTSQTALIVGGSVTLQNMPDYIDAGIVALTTDLLTQGPIPNMADIITKARQWTRRWKQLKK